MRPTPLTEARRELAAAYLPLARKLAGPFKAAAPHWRDEFESAACLALARAARSFDPSRGLRFATYARFRISHALRDARPDPRELPLEPWFDVADDAPSPAPAWESEEDFEARIRCLPAGCRDVLRARFLGDLSQGEAAASLGLSQTGVSRRERLALDLLRSASA